MWRSQKVLEWAPGSCHLPSFRHVRDPRRGQPGEIPRRDSPARFPGEVSAQDAPARRPGEMPRFRIVAESCTRSHK